ncbi:ABC-type transport system involved in resistance to organic solvents, periplasmic component [Desulfamplus magnetovallimortis]|uniref:ABC-type transport system involved in resistance to organic solvents, periplasmic component n=1 Tax=Desulfamplus magnetovallimortis TaxID=1246637 RepID=A0A1W1H6N7_9BACT|nr:outer membrane lipid asymmetry maintenance protein MlaD [Desulfamplus magnetovallimortis]SLM28119.1 ABC-type transport system involved in resistance to organic solvents, periplasmic component [Desulfamplus magnetovallimortis]
MNKNSYTLHEIIAGLFVLAGIAVIAIMTVRLGDVSFWGNDGIFLTARFSTVSGLRVGNPVEMHGIEVGKVESLEIDQKLQMAVATFALGRDIEIYSDAIASIKTAGLIGDKFVNIDPGGSGDLLKNSDTIINTESPVDLGELIGKYAFGSVDSGTASSPSESGHSSDELPDGFNLNLDE